jgi:pSer/pThr/pTyr-binding forkhead associated (FHA) protein
VTVDGLFVEDLGSANGSFVNGKRVRQSKLEPGDELKLDTVRFLIQAPGMDNTKQEAPTMERSTDSEDEEKSGSSAVKWVVILTVLIAVTVAGLKFGGII